MTKAQPSSAAPAVERRRWFRLRSLRSKLVVTGLLLQAFVLVTYYLAAGSGSGYLGFGALLLAVSALATYLIVTRLTRNLRQVQQTALALERGELDARCRVVSRDELGSFAASFDRMADSIQALNEQLEQRVAERTAELTRANRELESFSYTVSHDLSAPLRAINGFSTLLAEELEGRLEPAAQHYLERLVAGSVQMQALIDDLLRLAQVSRSRLVAREVDLAALARGVADECAFQHEPRSVAFEAAPGLRARGDASLLRIALANLIGNAWKFTARSDSPRVEFGVLERAGERIYFLRDNGAGFEMEHAAQLFKPFQRLHSARDFPGTGIGLAIVHRIVERHGGRIWVESAPGAGTSFFFTLGPAG